MGRPESCVLFAQSFVHTQLDEYVDEVLFAEPVVISSCEFLEQNASSSNTTVSLVGATSPPSFALEVFVQCEGESRFRRLCQPFLYSHSSSNVLEVEAVVTNHLVVRGSYRSLTLVVYGNTAEDLGQFNIDVDLDSSLANLVCSPPEGKLEDLPPALHPTKLPFEESISNLKSLSLEAPELDLSAGMKEFLLLTFRICQKSGEDDTVCKVVNTVASAVSSYISGNHYGTTVTFDRRSLGNFMGNKNDPQKVRSIIADARNELFELYKSRQPSLGSEPTELLEEEDFLESKAGLATSELLVYLFNQCLQFTEKTPAVGHLLLSQKTTILRLGVVLLLCSARESCFRFVNSGGMEQITRIFCHEVQRSTSTTLLLLCVVEHSTRHAIGCEGFLGWWPREDENVPVGNSNGYSCLLSLLMQKQRHDIASLATYLLHRLRSYEIAARYESAVLSVLGNLSADCGIITDGLNALVTVNSQLKKFLKLLHLRGPIEDPSPVAFVKSFILGQGEGLLSYRATIDFITLSKYGSSAWDIDSHLLSLLKERGFLPLSAALLSSPSLRSANGSTMEIFMDIAASIELILLSLLCCRSGLTFLLLQPEATGTLILSLKGAEDTDTEESMTLRHAAVLISKGFFCRPQEIGMIAELHLRVGNAIDRLLTVTPHSEEQLWLLWELCAISRSDSGRQALLSVGQFQEAVSVLMEALRSFKDLEPVGVNSGSSPLSLAIFHSAAEIFEVMITDLTASSLSSWIGHAVDLHKALHSSSPGSSRKDAPTRVLEWIDAGVVYHRNGAIGLLRYAAILASGGDAHLSSTSVLVSDSMDVENVVGDSSTGSDSQVVDNLLGKLVSDKCFDGVPLHNTSVMQLTTTFRILAFISEKPAVAVSLFEEGAMTHIYVVLVNCRFMLERSSNSFDYLVDEGAECNSTSDLLSERSHEQSLVELMIPCLVLLINLLKKLREVKEQYRNTKLRKALLQLHRELSPKLAACATDLSFPYPDSALGLGAVCHLLVSALACWPVFGWTPGLFHCLLESVQASSSLALGPKDACSLLCLLGDLFPEEDIWLWKNGVPSLSALRVLSIGTILGPKAESDADWYLQPEHLTVILGRLTPQLDKIGQIVLHFAFTALVVVQDMLRVFVVRIACQRAECAISLLKPILSSINAYLNDTADLSETDIFKMYKLLEFIARLLEHPRAKTLLLEMGVVEILARLLERFYDVCNSDDKPTPEGRPAKSAVNVLSWSLPVFRSLALIFDPPATLSFDKCSIDNLNIRDSSTIGRHLLKLCQVLPVGRELVACLIVFKELASCSQGRSALASICLQIPSSSLEVIDQVKMDKKDNLPDAFDWRSLSPLLICWKKLLRSIDTKDSSAFFSIEAVHALSLGGLCLCMEGKNMLGVATLKSLFGLPYDVDDAIVSEELLKDVYKLIALLDQRISEDEYLPSLTKKTALSRVKELAKSMFSQLQRPSGLSVKADGLVSSEGSTSIEDVASSVIHPLLLMPLISMNPMFDEASFSLSHVWKSNEDSEKDSCSASLGGLMEKFVWECPDSSLDRLVMPSLPVKRKLSSGEGSNRRSRGDNTGPDAMASNVFSRGLGAPSSSSGPTRRDTFRQRKPNTSRPPSMHVDDYVARERNVDGVGSAAIVVSGSQRGGSGRPPSIHVDEFMARQRERQNPMAVTVGDAVQARNAPVENVNDLEKSDKSQKLKVDLDDDLHEINIVFDEESESDDRLPFPQLDDNLQPAPVIIGESSPGSVVEDSEADGNDSTRFTRLRTPITDDGDSRTGFPLRRSIYRPGTSLAQETHVSRENYGRPNMEKTFFQEQSDESKYVAPTSKGFDTPPPTNLHQFSSHFYNLSSTTSSAQTLADSRLAPATFYSRVSPQKAVNISLSAGPPGYYEQKPPANQPPLPPMPHPTVSSMPSQTVEPVQNHSSPYIHSVRDVQPPLPSGYPLQAFDGSGPGTIPTYHVHSETRSTSNSSSMPSTTSQPVGDSKYQWVAVSPASRLHGETHTSSTSALPLPPLPPTPPPFSSPPMTQSFATNSGSQPSVFSQGAQPSLPSNPLSDSRFGIFSNAGSSLTSYSLAPFTPPWLTSVSGTLFSSSTQQLGQNPTNLPLALPSPHSSIQSVQPHPPLPPPPPQPPHPRHPQHSRQHIQSTQPQTEKVIALQQNPIQVQVQPVQVQQQIPFSPIHVYYQPQQQENLSQPPQPMPEQAQPLIIHTQADNAPQLLQDSGLTLQKYFSSPEAIQSLLSDRDKLCQLLEQHPKLMQMLQERLGQL